MIDARPHVNRVEGLRRDRQVLRICANEIDRLEEKGEHVQQVLLQFDPLESIQKGIYRQIFLPFPDKCAEPSLVTADVDATPDNWNFPVDVCNSFFFLNVILE